MKMTFASKLNLLLLFCSAYCHAIVLENHADDWVQMRIGSPADHNLIIFVVEKGETYKQDYLPPVTVLTVKYHDHITQYQFAAKDAPKAILKITNHNGKANIPLLDAYKVHAKVGSGAGVTEAERKRSSSHEHKEKGKA